MLLILTAGKQLEQEFGFGFLFLNNKFRVLLDQREDQTPSNIITIPDLEGSNPFLIICLLFVLQSTERSQASHPSLCALTCEDVPKAPT